MSLAGTPLLRTEPPDGRRQQLIETTIVVLAEFGYVGTTLGRIGARAGVSAGLVAHYFGDKDTLLEAAEFMRALEKRQGFKIACPEEVAFNLGWIDAGQLRALGHRLEKSTYGRYLLRIADGE